MGKRDERRRFERKPAELMAQYWDAREDELLDAVVSAAALVARADGRIDGAERGQLLDFLERRGSCPSSHPPRYSTLSSGGFGN
jgi:tellurite resistance protein